VLAAVTVIYRYKYHIETLVENSKSLLVNITDLLKCDVNAVI
jgi:hypothetical protein